MTSIFPEGMPASSPSLLKISSRSRSPFIPLVEPLATTTKRPPPMSVSLGILFAISPRNRAGSPDEPTLNCQHVFSDPSHSSVLLGLADQPSQPSSRAFP